MLDGENFENNREHWGKIENNREPWCKKNKHFKHICISAAVNNREHCKYIFVVNINIVIIKF